MSFTRCSTIICYLILFICGIQLMTLSETEAKRTSQIIKHFYLLGGGLYLFSIFCNLLVGCLILCLTAAQFIKSKRLKRKFSGIEKEDIVRLFSDFRYFLVSFVISIMTILLAVFIWMNLIDLKTIGLISIIMVFVDLLISLSGCFLSCCCYLSLGFLFGSKNVRRGNIIKRARNLIFEGI